MGPRRMRPPSPCSGGLGGGKAKEVPSTMRRGPRGFTTEGAFVAHEAGASVIPKRKQPPLPYRRGTGGPKAKEAPSPMRRGP